MAKRTYHPEHKRLFKLGKSGSYFTFVGGEDKSLETDDLETALQHLKFLDETVSFFGAAAFKNKIGDLFPVFLKQKSSELGDRTNKEYEKIWKVFKKDGLDKVALGAFSQKRWLRFCKSRKHNIRDFQNYRNLMHQFLVWCSMYGYIRAVVILKNPKHTRRKRKVILPEHLVLILKEAAKSRGMILTYLTILAIHGPRGVEPRKARWVDVDFENMSMTFRDETVKTRAGRQIPLHPMTVQVLKKHLGRQREAGVRSKWIFPNAVDSKRHMSDTGFKTAWKTCIKNAGLKEFGYTPHDLRSTYEMWLELSALNETQKRKASGASRDVRLNTYVTMTADHLRGAESVVRVPELFEILKAQAIQQLAPTGKLPEKNES